MGRQKSYVNKLFHTQSQKIEIFQRYESTLLHTNISESFRSFASGDFGHKILKSKNIRILFTIECEKVGQEFIL